MKIYQDCKVKIICQKTEDVIRTSQPTAVTNDYFEDSNWWETEIGGDQA